MKKVIIYSLLPRLWGNQNKDLKAWGTIQENGTGLLSDIDQNSLNYIRSLGANYVWYIGLLEHATASLPNNIPTDPQEIVKGKAGSPYAVKDYYDIASYLCKEPSKRLQEFDALVERTHQAGLGFIMDFIPNHVARTYQSDSKPQGIEDFGARDCKDKFFDPNNNFYYFPDESLQLPLKNYSYQETPARATGNDVFNSCPSINDWFETVKLNYGYDPFNPKALEDNFIPDTWMKMYNILNYWSARGVDGFRCDMAELVPTSFWSWVIPKLKEAYPNLFFLAEIYQKEHYSDYLLAGFDYLYDKVGVYDSMRLLIQGHGSVEDLEQQFFATENFQEKMCYFIENHDEQRLASEPFAHSTASTGPILASLVLSGTNPFLLYFAQELGEEGMDEEGFSGHDGRTTIFDYWALDKLQRLQQGAYTTEYLSEKESKLLALYQEIIPLVHQESCFHSGTYYGLNYAQHTTFPKKSCLLYARCFDGQCILVLANFSNERHELALHLPKAFFTFARIQENVCMQEEDLLAQNTKISTLTSLAPYMLSVEALAIRIIKFQTQ